MFEIIKAETAELTTKVERQFHDPSAPRTIEWELTDIELMMMSADDLAQLEKRYHDVADHVRRTGVNVEFSTWRDHARYVTCFRLRRLNHASPV